MDLRADTRELSRLARSLRTISARLEAASDDVSVLHAELGSGRLAETMDRFASDWRVRRGRLCESIEAVAQMAAESAERYEGCDDALAKSISGRGE